MAVVRSYTVVVGVDARYREQIRESSKTWRKNCPQLWAQPWRVFYDWRQVSADQVAAAICDVGNIAELRLIPWPGTAVDESSLYCADKFQRHKMLAGFVHVGATVETDYWLKLDCDAVKADESEFPRAEWFDLSTEGSSGSQWTEVPGMLPAWIASSWGYTKPAGQMFELEQWCNREAPAAFPEASGDRFPPLGFPKPEDGTRRLRHPRHCSWVAFYQADFSRFAAFLAARGCAPFSIPVPSQDGYHNYIASRFQFASRRVSMKRHGWANYSSLAKLRQAVAEVLGE